MLAQNSLNYQSKGRLIFVSITIILVGCNDVDKCLDSGGSFDYENCRCDYENKHPYLKAHECGASFLIKNSVFEFSVSF